MTTALRLPPALVALSDGDLDGGGVRGFVERARAARAAGLAGIMLREPLLGDRDLLVLAHVVRRLFDRAGGGWLAVHDRAHIAEAADADACHAGFRSLTPVELRTALPDRIAIGLSTHAGDADAAWRGADYLVHGPVFETPSKRGLLEPIGLPGVADAVRRSAGRTPVHAIGGLRPENARAVLDAGASGVFARAAVLGADDPARAVHAFLQALAR